MQGTNSKHFWILQPSKTFLTQLPVVEDSILELKKYFVTVTITKSLLS